jgi:release factor glutamine methyltransferase
VTRDELTSEVLGQLGPGNEARWLVEEVLGLDNHRRALSDHEQYAVRALVERRLAGVPLQYVLGHWPFRTVDLVVDPRVLIPRPETEQVVEFALGELAQVVGTRSDPVVVDLGTGSGAIALSIAAECASTRPVIQVWATDSDPEALTVAGYNRTRLADMDPAAAGRVQLAGGSWFAALPAGLRGQVDLVIANPPYVSADEWGALDPEVRLEPYHALVSGPDDRGTPGLGCLAAIIGQAPAWLARPAVLVLEIAPAQAAAAAARAAEAGFGAVAVRADLAGRDRALVARI